MAKTCRHTYGSGDEPVLPRQSTPGHKLDCTSAEHIGRLPCRPFRDPCVVRVRPPGARANGNAAAGTARRRVARCAAVPGLRVAPGAHQHRLDGSRWVRALCGHVVARPTIDGTAMRLTISRRVSSSMIFLARLSIGLFCASVVADQPPEIDATMKRVMEIERQIDLLEAEKRTLVSDVSADGKRRVLNAGPASTVYSRYLASWKNAVDAAARRYNARTSARAGLDTTVLVHTAVRSDGSIERVRVVRSSGDRAIDAAVRAIIECGAIPGVSC